MALYTPPQLAMMAVDSVHAVTGMPYWMTIVAITLGIRTAILPIGLLAARNGARTAVMKPEMDALQDAIKVRPTRLRFFFSLLALSLFGRGVCGVVLVLVLAGVVLSVLFLQVLCARTHVCVCVCSTLLSPIQAPLFAVRGEVVFFLLSCRSLLLPAHASNPTVLCIEDANTFLRQRDPSIHPSIHPFIYIPCPGTSDILLTPSTTCN